MPKLALHAIKDTGRYQRTKPVADETTTRQDSSADTQFRTLVPLREQEKGTGKERGFHETEEETREEGADKASTSS